MKFMAGTIVNYILDQTKKNIGRTLRFVLPSYPPDLLYEIGNEIAERTMKSIEHRIGFEYGIAYRLGEKWENGTQEEKVIFQQIKNRNWYNYTDNMTRLRHLVKREEDDSLIVLLAGYEDIRDQASLQDFFHLDQKTLWNICLRKSFEPWVIKAVQNYVNPEGNEEAIKKIAGIMGDLYQFGLADPLQISRYLQNKDFSKAMDGRDALKEVLADLSVFGLPNMIGFEKHGKKNFIQYLEAAQKFMNYSNFIDEQNRRKAYKRIDLFWEENKDKEEPEPEVRGAYGKLEDLVASLRRYVETGSPQELEKLATADFIYINDRILQFKLSGPNGPRKSITKLRGHALEVFLHALWLSLSDFKSENRSMLLLPLDNIAGISFKSLEFKHQYGHDDEERAQEFLHKLLGGIDEYLMDYLEIERSDKSLISVESFLSPGRAETNEIKYSAARAAMPGLVFEVTIYGQDGSTLSRKFTWVLEKNSQARFLVQLFDWVIKNYEKYIVLPVFKTQYVNELFMVKNEEDIVRILNIAMEKQSCSIDDLFNAPNLDKKDILKDNLFKLSACYQEFLQEYSRAGFISALRNKFDSIRKSYTELFVNYLDNSTRSSIGLLLTKSFLFISTQYASESNWQWKKTLNCGVVTPLHPALLEMIHHQHAYLCKSFCSYVKKGLAESGTRSLSINKWHRLMDLSKIKWPLLGLLNDNLKLSTNVRSYDYIHLVGDPDDGYSTISSRLLVKYEDDEDEDISDAELFRETQEGKLIKHILLDYCKLHPYGNDGLSVGVYCGGTIQQLIGGIDAFLKEVADNKDDAYSFNLTIFSDSSDDTGVLTWVNAWKERWQNAKDASSRHYYANSMISINYKVVGDGDREQLAKLLHDTDLDLMFFINFTRHQESRFVPLENLCPFGIDDYLKFPVLEKMDCIVIDGGNVKERGIVLNNRRFRLGTLHGEVMARLDNPFSQCSEHVVVSSSNYAPWETVIDAAHKNCVWVVCIDPIVDEKLIRKGGGNDREIIGFGTGVGPHGEYNFTVSTEQFYLLDIVNKISRQLTNLLDSNDKDVIDLVAENLIKESFSMSGLSIVKATGPSEYVRDFIAYTLIRKLLPKENGVLCDEIISLDAFLHWFDFGSNEVRPDLLRLQAKIEGEAFKIRAQIIECKMAQESEGYLERALRQIEEGLTRLIPKFRPRQTSTPVGIEEREMSSYPPDQRYWWMQLHRLISSRGEVRYADYPEVLRALENLSEGCYDIEWEAAAIVFWVDVPNGELHKTPQWSFMMDNQEMDVYSVQCGKDFILKAGLGQEGHALFDGSSTISYQYARPQNVCIDSPEEKKDENEQIFTLPGNEVVVPDEKGQAKPAYQQREIPKRIYLGSGSAGGREVFWEFGHPDLPNRHLLIFGASGTGKTYTIQAVMAELSKCSINSLIVDYTNGFTTQQLEPIIVKQLKPKQHVIRRKPLAINPFRKQCDYIDGEPLEDTSAQVAQRASGVFAEVYRLGEQQKALIYNTIQAGVEEAGETFNLNMLIQKLDDIRAQGGITANTALTILNKIKPFVDMNPFGQEDPDSWEKLFLDPDSRCHVIQLAGFSKDYARLITEFFLIDLYWYYRTRGSKDKPRVIILDEIQNLDHSLESPLGQFLTEGRKFGISLILATQTLSNLSKDERDRLFQASHKLFFKPADTEIKAFAQLLADATSESQDSWVQRLSGLKRGECFSLGYAFNPGTNKLEVNRAFKIKIKPLEERF